MFYPFEFAYHKKCRVCRFVVVGGDNENVIRKLISVEILGILMFNLTQNYQLILTFQLHIKDIKFCQHNNSLCINFLSYIK